MRCGSERNLDDKLYSWAYKYIRESKIKGMRSGAVFQVLQLTPKLQITSDSFGPKASITSNAADLQ